jgi:hypothetical protein
VNRVSIFKPSPDLLRQSWIPPSARCGGHTLHLTFA